jgi:hypothetical protein
MPPLVRVVGFGAWFKDVQQAGLVCASYQKHGEIWLVLPDESIVKLLEFVAAHPELPPLPETMGVCSEIKKVPTPVPPQPVDLSDVIAQTTVEVQRLGWSAEKVVTFLKEQFNQRSRSQLTDEELYKFLNQLQNMR